MAHLEKFTTFMLFGLVAVSATVALQFLPVPLSDLSPTDIVARFLGLVFIALVIERAVEIYIKNRFQVADALAKTEGQPSLDLLKQSKRRAAAIASLTLSLAVSASGLRVLAQFLPDTGDSVINRVALQAMVFHSVDIVLTCLLLSGGADGMHHLIKGFLCERDVQDPR